MTCTLALLVVGRASLLVHREEVMGASVGRTSLPISVHRRRMSAPLLLLPMR